MKVFANKKTKVAHADNRRGDACKQRALEPKNIRKFESLADAEAEGFRACKRCRPE